MNLSDLTNRELIETIQKTIDTLNGPEMLAADQRQMAESSLKALHLDLCERLGNLDGQIDKLANFIMAEIPGEPSQNEGAVDTAIRLLQKALEEGLFDGNDDDKSFFCNYLKEEVNIDYHPKSICLDCKSSTCQFAGKEQKKIKKGQSIRRSICSECKEPITSDRDFFFCRHLKERFHRKCLTEEYMQDISCLECSQECEFAGNEDFNSCPVCDSEIGLEDDFICQHHSQRVHKDCLPIKDLCWDCAEECPYIEEGEPE